MKQPITILCIDDDKEILYALEAIFEFKGWKSVIATDVPSGIKSYLNHNPDIILIDYHLPRINGIEGVKMLRQFSSDVPIIVFTIDEDQEVANSFLEVGASDFALKPIKAPDLISRINLHIQLIDKKSMTKNKELKVPKQTEEKLTEDRLIKGISSTTLELIMVAMEETYEFMTVEDIAHETGLAYQTTYRYIQYMEKENLLDVHTAYGKVGRPKNSYRLLNMGWQNG
ncbi:MAG: response regulator [Tissierellaceae bacterium]|nr:response regulator [Tissierellaceae bacterium]